MTSDDKACSKCRETKPTSEFGKDSQKRDGLTSSCKVCRSLSAAASRSANPEAYRASSAKWRASNIEKVRANSARWQIENTEKVKAKSAKWYAENKEKANTRAAKRNSENRDKCRLSQAKWRAKNIENSRARSAKWSKENPEKAAQNAARRRAVRRSACPVWGNGFFIREIYDLAKLRSRLTGIKHVVDHVVPLVSKAVCGLHVEHNLRVITHHENSVKGNFHWPDMGRAN